MKSILLAVSCTCLLLCAISTAAARPDLTSQKGRESYSIGYQVGSGIRVDGVEVDLEGLVEGLQDAIGGKDPRLTQEEMKKLVSALRKKAAEAQQKRFQEQMEKNLRDGEAFLTQNKTREGVKTTESGLQYKVLKEGEGPSPKPTDTVTVHYRGTLIDGTEFDSSHRRNKPETFEVDGVIKGWTEALPLMRVGSEWQLFVPSELAYGRQGQGALIPPNSVLVFEIKLLSIEAKPTSDDASPPPPSEPK